MTSGVAVGRAILGGMLAVLLFDAAASWASKSVGFAYSKAAVGSWLIYAVVGFVAGRAAGVFAAVVAGAAVGLFDASAGWAVSWAIGAGRMPGLTTAGWLRIAAFVATAAAAVAGVGGAIGWRARAREGRVSVTRSMKRFIEFDTVRIVTIHGPAGRHLAADDYERLPEVGDVGTIVHLTPTYDPDGTETRFIVESVDTSGRSVWLAEFSREELELVSRPV